MSHHRVDFPENRAEKRLRVWLLALLLALTGLRLQAGPSPVQTYFIPAGEAQLRSAFLASSAETGTSIWNVISLSPGGSNTVIYYDHHENGYESDIANPANLFSPTNPGGTQVWGDNNPTNGIPPGFAADRIGPGAIIVLTNAVPVPRAPGLIRYDGGDRIATTRAIEVTLVSWPLDPGPVLADAIEVVDTGSYGTNFMAPVGVNACTTLPKPMFDFTAFSVMAAQNDTVVRVDTNGDGTVDLTVTLNQGASFMANSNGTLRAGATIRTSKPVQAHLFTGRRNSQYQNRWFTLQSVERWSTNYYACVGTTDSSHPAAVVLYNPYTNALAVRYRTRSTSSGSVSLAAKSARLITLPSGSGGLFTADRPFTGVSVVDVPTTSSDGDDYDWGSTLLTEDALTASVLVGFGAGSADLSLNGNPVWVMALQPTTLFVDYDADPATGPRIDSRGNHYDTSYSITNYESKRIFNTSRNDQTGMRIYTTNGVKIVAAWGEDPDSAPTGNPCVDAGTTIAGLPNITGTKKASLCGDVNTNGLCEPGDEILYTIWVNNEGGGDLRNVAISDPLPSNTVYSAGSTAINGVSLPDNSKTNTTPYPLDEDGLCIASLPSFSSVIVTFRVRVAHPFPAGISTIRNRAVATSTGGQVIMEADMPVVMADLSLSKTATPTLVPPEAPFLFTLTVSNAGPQAVTAVAVRDPLPPGLTLIPGGAAPYNPANGTWSIPSLPAGASTALTLTVRMPAPGIVTNTAEIIASSLADPDSLPGNAAPGEDDVASATVTCLVSSVRIVKTAGPADDGAPHYITAGSAVPYSYLITNTGKTPLANVQVTDDKLGLVGAIPGLLLPGDSLLLTKIATVRQSVTNIGTVTGTPADPAGRPLPLFAQVRDTNAAVVQVVTPALSLLVRAGDAPDGETYCTGKGCAVPYAFCVLNTGDTCLKNVTVSDDKLGYIGTLPGVLAPGQCLTLCATNPRALLSVVDVGSATGTPCLADGTALPGLAPVSDTDDAAVAVFQAAVTLTETAGTAPDGTLYYCHKGAPVPYAFKIVNNGDSCLKNLSVTDSRLGYIGTLTTVLPPGASGFLYATNAAMTLSAVSTGTVTAIPCLPNGAALTNLAAVADTDDAAVQVFLPAVSLVDTAGDAPDGQTYYTRKGSAVPYAYKVVNTGDACLKNLTVTDDRLGLVGTVTNVLAPGASRILYATNAAMTLSTVSTGTVTAIPCLPNGTTLTNLAAVSDLDDAAVQVFLPAITLIETAGTAPDGSIYYTSNGSPVAYAFRLVNNGDSCLKNMTVTDDRLGLIGIVTNILAPGASRFLYATNAAMTLSAVSTGTVSAIPCLPNGAALTNLAAVTDTDDAAVQVFLPAITLIETAGDAPDGQTYYTRKGSAVPYAYKVVNTGDACLKNLTVTDDRLGLIGIVTNILAPGANRILYATNAAMSLSAVSMGTVSATPCLPNGTTLTNLAAVLDTDDAAVQVFQPAIRLVLTAGSLPDGEICYTRKGSAVPYAYKIINTGDVCLKDITVTDDRLGLIGELVGPMPPGDSRTMRADNPCVTLNTLSHGLVTGIPCLPDGTDLPLTAVTHSDDAAVEVFLPALSLVKTAGTAPDGSVYYAQPGETVTFTYRLRNSGDTWLANLAVDDDVLGPIASIPGPVPPGWSTNLTATQADVEEDVVNLGTAQADPVFPDGTAIPELEPLQARDDADTRIALFLVRKEDSPDPVQPGQALSYVLWVANPSENPILGLQVTEHYPESFHFASATPAPSASNNVWVLETLEPGGLWPIVISGTVDGRTKPGSSLTNRLVVASGNAGTHAVEEPTRVESAAASSRTRLRLTKRDDADPVPPGAELAYTIRVENLGPVTATNVTVTETFDPFFTFLSALPAPASGTDNTWSLGKLAPNTAVEITIRGRVSALAPPGYVLVDAAEARARNADPASDAELTLVGDRPPLEIRKTADANPVLGSHPLCYTVTVSNPGPVAIQGVSVIETYDPDFAYASSEPAPLPGSSNVWFLGDLPPESQRTIVIRGLVLKRTLPEDVLFNTVEAVCSNGSRTAHLATRVINPKPNPVTLLSFRSTEIPGGVKLKWETAAESETLGYHLYRSSSLKGGRIRLNATLIPSDSPADGGVYRFTDLTAVPGIVYYYWLEEVAWNYRSLTYGPLIHGARPPTGAVAAFSLPADGGLIRIRHEALERAGLASSPLDPRSLTVLLGGQPLPIYVNAAGAVLKPGDFLLVYAPPGAGPEAFLSRRANPPRMAAAPASPLAGRGEVLMKAAGRGQTLPFTVEPDTVRCFLYGFTGLPVWVLDVTEPASPVMLYGWSAAMLESGKTGLYLSRSRAGTTVRGLAVQDAALIEPDLRRP